VYWLNGLFELGGDTLVALDARQIMIIRNHLNLVFKHMDEHDDEDEAAKTGLAPEDIAAIKQAIHDGKKRPPHLDREPAPLPEIGDDDNDPLDELDTEGD